MTRFAYSGPVQGLTLTDAGGAVLFDGMLIPGRAAELPEDHPVVAGLVAMNRLVAVATASSAAAEAAPPKTRRRTEEN